MSQKTVLLVGFIASDVPGEMNGVCDVKTFPEGIRQLNEWMRSFSGCSYAYILLHPTISTIPLRIKRRGPASANKKTSASAEQTDVCPPEPTFFDAFTGVMRRVARVKTGLGMPVLERLAWPEGARPDNAAADWEYPPDTEKTVLVNWLKAHDCLLAAPADSSVPAAKKGAYPRGPRKYQPQRKKESREAV